MRACVRARVGIKSYFLIRTGVRFSVKAQCIELAQNGLMQTSIWMPLFGANTFGPLEKLLVGLQGSGRSRWKGLSKTNIFMWY